MSLFAETDGMAYTEGMMQMVTCLLMALAAQNADAPDSTYIFQLQDGREFFARSYREERDARGRRLFVLETDGPWRPTTRTIRESELEPGYPVRELSSARNQRIEAGWEERGYRLVTLPSGERRPVARAEADLADKAREWAISVEAYVEEQNRATAPAPPDTPMSESHFDPPSAPVNEPGPGGGQWLLVGTIAAGAVVLIGVLLKTLVLA